MEGCDEASHVVEAVEREPHSRHGFICELDLDSPDVCGLPPAAPGRLPLVLDKACPHHSHVHHCAACWDDKAAEVAPRTPEHPRVLREHKVLPAAWVTAITAITATVTAITATTTTTTANLAQDIQGPALLADLVSVVLGVRGLADGLYCNVL